MFYRGKLNFPIKKKINGKEEIEWHYVKTWMSDYQAIQLLRADHTYIDRTFYTAPKGEK